MNFQEIVSHSKQPSQTKNVWEEDYQVNYDYIIDLAAKMHYRIVYQI